MRPGVLRTFALSVLAACWIALGTPAPKAAAEGNAAAGQEPAEYRRLVDEAVSEFEAGRVQESRALFTRAHAIYPSARTLRGLGMTEFELRNYPASIRALEEALASKVRPLDGGLRAETEKLLTRAREFVSRLVIERYPADARVVVDGIAVPLAPGQALLLTVGEHVLEVQADGFVSERRALSVKGAGEEKLSIQLRANPAPAAGPAAPPRPAVQTYPAALPPPAWQTGRAAPAQPVAAAVVAPAAPRAAPPAAGPVAQPAASSPAAPSGAADRNGPGRPTSKTGAAVLTGISAALLVGGATLIGVGFREIAKVEHASDGTQWSDVESQHTRAPALTGSGFAIGAVGAVGLIGGLVWLLKKPKAQGHKGARALQLATGRF